MYLEKLTLTNYRNYESLNSDFSFQVNLLRGFNAQGKTNLLEAIYYLAIGKAYRSIREDQLIKWGHHHFSIKGQVKNKIGQTNLEVFFHNQQQVKQLRRVKRVQKEIKVNGLKVGRTADFLSNLTAVLFAPENLSIIQGSPTERRKLLDYDISQVNPSYFLQLQQYQQILKQRNHLLRKIVQGRGGLNELEIWNLQLKNVSESIIRKRLQVLEKLTPLTRLMQRKLTGGRESLEFKYYFNRKKEIKNGDDLSDLLDREIKRVRTEELNRGITLWGPHRDDFLLTVNGINLKIYGSQGQHRTAVLAIKLAELEFFKSESGEYPLLLLDDVLSELDQERREHLLQIIQSKAIQCFITTTEDVSSFWHSKSNFASFYVENGVLK
ncbi:MAG: DNA replication/repair protein RecF [Clostridia bacterium]|nr:DNA replication/repair protein RecF [Clostridia bacterium]MDD4146297.1 DNA replication/repair protein RecF [Clostridia bacterium]MDD4665318.1 DNA replication/repair protein RecF [Clostridia bacterium]